MRVQDLSFFSAYYLLISYVSPILCSYHSFLNMVRFTAKHLFFSLSSFMSRRRHRRHHHRNHHCCCSGKQFSFCFMRMAAKILLDWGEKNMTRSCQKKMCFCSIRFKIIEINKRFSIWKQNKTKQNRKKYIPRMWNIRALNNRSNTVIPFPFPLKEF